MVPEGTLAGESRHASLPELPAATANVNPAVVAPLNLIYKKPFTALSSAADAPPPKDILATLLRFLFFLAATCLAAHSIPAITPEVVPDP